MVINIADLEEQAINLFSRLGFSREISSLIWILIDIIILLLGITIGLLVIVWLERKISAGIQQRIGPEYAGPLGIIQALTDGIKLLLKEDIIPSRGDIWLFSIGPAVVVIPIFLGYLVIPFGRHIILMDLSIGVFFGLQFQVLLPLDCL